MLKQQKGFTLIELLVVIVVIGILVALTLPNLFAAQERARDSERKNDLRNISQQLETYYNDRNEYPAANDLYDETSDFADYMEEVPTDPQGDDEYTYSPEPDPCDNDVGDTCGAYTLTATLENDEDPDGTEDGGDTLYIVESVNQI